MPLPPDSRMWSLRRAAAVGLRRQPRGLLEGDGRRPRRVAGGRRRLGRRRAHRGGVAAVDRVLDASTGCSRPGTSVPARLRPRAATRARSSSARMGAVSSRVSGRLSGPAAALTVSAARRSAARRSASERGRRGRGRPRPRPAPCRARAGDRRRRAMRAPCVRSRVRPRCPGQQRGRFPLQRDLVRVRCVRRRGRGSLAGLRRPWRSAQSRRPAPRARDGREQ